jgi:hypothetical protein
VGVAVEVALVVLEHKTELKDFRRGTIRSPERPNKLKFGIEALAAVLVASGVAGELVIDVRAGKIQTQLRNKNGRLIQLLEGGAGEALNHAIEVEEFNKQLSIRLEVERQKTAYVQKEAEILRKRAEDEAMARVQMQLLISARHIPQKELPKLAASLNDFKGKTLYLESYANDPESYGLGLSILTALRSVPLVVWDHLGLVMAPGPVRTGIAVAGPKTESKFVYALSDAISKAGRLGGTASDEAPPGSAVRVFVGIKQPFWFGVE